MFICCLSILKRPSILWSIGLWTRQCISKEMKKKYRDLIAGLYRKSMGRIKTERRTGSCFRLQKGFKQVDPVSANLFNAVLEEIFKSMNWENKGIKVDGKWLSNLRFADDVVLISSSLDELQEMAEELAVKSEMKGMKMSFEKTKFLSNREDVDFRINGECIEVVTSYVYLGQAISVNRDLRVEIKNRIRKAWGKYWSYIALLKSKITNSSKIKILNNFVFPSLTYGAQSWALTKELTNRVQSTTNRMIRSILGIKWSDKVTNKKL